ncbi:MAG: phosphoribosyltransferase [Chitinophagaceae bacterium]|jgi:pyrimidine operon attenuation protein/uracil phosphoribosyltransferase|nr:phosphoribosyltransferase [Chitinophagaceae bacterium]
MENSKNYILDAKTAGKKLRRMAYQILENNNDEESIILAGIKESGGVVARNLQKMLAEISPLKTELMIISLDKKKPGKIALDKEMNFTGKVIIIIDDVANSGRTLLYALKPFLDFLPKKIQTLVLVERSHKIFPVHSDYVGISIATTMQEHIYVEVENEIITGAYLA